jgi:hypothetical protein
MKTNLCRLLGAEHPGIAAAMGPDESAIVHANSQVFALQERISPLTPSYRSVA